jgi:class 3 adenylate cyclase/pSer/pThr/pTyr-binding forkhead associated (FHA) protein
MIVFNPFEPLGSLPFVVSGMTVENENTNQNPPHDTESTRELEALRRGITVLFTDIKGSTAYFERFGDAAGLVMVNRCNGMMSKCVVGNNGRVIKTIGDSIMAAFDNHVDAIVASIEMQQVLAADNLTKSEPHRVSIRIGINYGTGIVKSNDVYGDVVNVASRVEGAATPGQIVISDSLYRALAGNDRFRVRHIGKFPLRGKASHHDLYEVAWKTQVDTRPAVSHSVIISKSDYAPYVRFKLVQIRSDGRSGKEFEVVSKEAYIGRDKGDLVFPHDDIMRSPHAKLVVEDGQLFLEPVEDSVSFFSLIGPYRLQREDVVKIGSQLLEFRADAEALESASLTGTAITTLSTLMQGPVAEFVSLNSDHKHYPLTEEQTTWGRTKATYVFPNDTTMSRAHAKVYHRGEDFFIEDAGSTNGTFIMAKERTPIPEGVILSVAGQLLRVSRDEFASGNVF